jgi:hypothetical protein
LLLLPDTGLTFSAPPLLADAALAVAVGDRILVSHYRDFPDGVVTPAKVRADGSSMPAA